MMDQWINMVEVNVDAPREDEFRNWFADIHMHDVLTTLGFLGARQHEIKEFRDGRGKYLHLYNIETDDIDRTMELRLQSREQEVQRGRHRAKLTMHVWRDVLWRQRAERVAPDYKKSTRQRWLNLVEVNCAISREEEFSDWYLNVHIGDVLSTPGFVGARHYETKEFRDGRGKYLNAYYLETDDIDSTMKLRLQKREEERKQGRYRDKLTMPVWRDVVWRRIAEHSAPGKVDTNSLPW